MTTPEKHRRPFVGPPQLQLSEKRRGAGARRTRLGRRGPRLHTAVVQRLDMSAFGAEGRWKRICLGDGLGGRGPLVLEGGVSISISFRDERGEDVLGFSAWQRWQAIFGTTGAALSSRSPQSVQKSRVPAKDMAEGGRGRE
jgi:hypothetical protein